MCTRLYIYKVRALIVYNIETHIMYIRRIRCDTVFNIPYNFWLVSTVAGHYNHRIYGKEKETKYDRTISRGSS